MTQNTERSREYLSIRQSALDIFALDVMDCPVDGAVAFEQVDQGFSGHQEWAFIGVCTSRGEITRPTRPAPCARGSANRSRRIAAATRRGVPKSDQPQGRDMMTRHSASAPCDSACEKSTWGKPA